MIIIKQMIGSVIMLFFSGKIEHHLPSFLMSFLYANSESFENSEQVTQNHFDMTPFYWAMTLIGGCIALTLTYVSWRKYQGIEKKKIRKNRKVP